MKKTFCDQCEKQIHTMPDVTLSEQSLFNSFGIFGPYLPPPIKSEYDFCSDKCFSDFLSKRGFIDNRKPPTGAKRIKTKE